MEPESEPFCNTDEPDVWPEQAVRQVAVHNTPPRAPFAPHFPQRDSDVRHYCLWDGAHAGALGIYSGYYPRVWVLIQAKLGGGHYKRGRDHLAKYDTWDQAAFAWPRYGPKATRGTMIPHVFVVFD